ncbi:MAG: transcription antitermination factor NusB [Pseudomonadota bacterium]
MTRTSKSKPPTARRAARISAVQALYQMDIAKADANVVIRQFETVVEEGGGDEDFAIEAADKTFFAELVRGVVRLQRTIDQEVDKQLADGWRLARVDSTVRQILRAALYELIDRPDVPAKVVINEYVDLSKEFFDQEEPRVINGVLDQLAKKHRPGELSN